jgi:hypothetical protein
MNFKVGGSVYVSEPPFSVYEVLCISWDEEMLCAQSKSGKNIMFIPRKAVFPTEALAREHFNDKKGNG